MMPIYTARPLVQPTTEADRYLPEGPRPLTAFGQAALSWVNIQTGPTARTGAVHLALLGTRQRRQYTLPARVGFAFPTDGPDTLFVGVEHAVGTLHLPTGKWTPYATLPQTDPRIIINDGEILPDGSGIVFGTKDTHFAEPLASLYLFTLKDNRLTELAPGQTCSNGKIIHPDTEADSYILYDIDTPTKTVVRSRLNKRTRQLAPPEVILDLRADPAFPDGMCDAGNNTAIIAFYNPHHGGDGVARHYDLRSGGILAQWNVPHSPRVTCPRLIWHGDLVRLVLTTATEGMPADHRATATDAGTLFVAETSLLTLPPSAIVEL
ncbi:MAG: SMP-30/gluconolactonase/LRE family protein [Gemmataceae bacterium]